MGFTRRFMSMSTAGMVSFHSPKEKEARAAAKQARAAERVSKAQAELLREQARLLRESRTETTQA